uniref:Ig-like domain-containing protein n=1 Tax=Naja naja TaxID=35670 RepID=A0A8C6V9G7_NAJNA
ANLLSASTHAFGGPGLRTESESVQITAGKTLTLNCTLTQMDLPTSAKWYKELSNDLTLTYRERYQFSRGVRLVPGSRTDFSISLSNMGPGDNGTYHYSKVQILDQEDQWFGRGVKEVIHLQIKQPSINRGGGIQHNLPPVYTTVLSAFPRRLHTHLHHSGDPEDTGKPPTGLNSSLKRCSGFFVQGLFPSIPQRPNPVSLPAASACRNHESQLLLTDLFGFLCSAPPTVRLETEPPSPVWLNTSVTVTCNAEYFYPNVAKVDLFCKNPSGKGKPAAATLNSNGTYSRQSSLKITATENWDSSLFTCLVKHNSTVFKATTQLFITTELGKVSAWGEFLSFPSIFSFPISVQVESKLRVVACRLAVLPAGESDKEVMWESGSASRCW